MGGLQGIYIWPLIAINKRPSIFQVGVGVTWRLLFAKCVLSFTVSEATNACQYEQLCAGLKSLIYRDLHGVQYIWDANSSMECCRFLLVDAKNMFSEVNQNIMLLTVRYLWTSRDIFLNVIVTGRCSSCVTVMGCPFFCIVGRA